MKHFFQKLPDSAIRLSIVIVALGFITLFLRFYLLPASVTDMDLHRASSVEREISKEPIYANSALCADCHVDEPDKKRDGYHAGLSCETCHGPSQEHLLDFEVSPRAPRGREFCPLCHAYNPSRPTGFPQINPVVHNPMDSCIECHDPHDPKPSEPPRECIACHAEIGRSKAVSHHVLLECTTCHVAPAQHKEEPRLIRPTKPTNREFCGQCHGEESQIQGPPKVDLVTHQTGYLCWQCHYPHLPEVR